ncbi:MAG: DinB family protein [Planctomycetes bacterium]|nr:DinB family protein [Planctomycetota bacterium]
MVECARKQIDFARNYTLGLLEGLDDALWFQQPEGCPTHIAWQVGHLAATEYLLTVFRLRGRERGDDQIMPKDLIRQFGKASQPNPNPAANPSPEQLRATLHAVHELAMAELPRYSDADLQDTVIEPYAAYNTKLGSLLFCAHHEMLHAGQIGLLRRQLGLEPQR